MKVEISPIVDLEDVKKDQRNKDLIIAETEQKITKLVYECSLVDLIPDKDIVGVWKKKTDAEKTMFQQRLFSASRTITHILALSEE